MTVIGLHVSHEQLAPSVGLAAVRMAEAAPDVMDGQTDPPRSTRVSAAEPTAADAAEDPEARIVDPSLGWSGTRLDPKRN